MTSALVPLMLTGRPVCRVPRQAPVVHYRGDISTDSDVAGHAYRGSIKTGCHVTAMNPLDTNDSLLTC
jgi:hypothetical protein